MPSDDFWADLPDEQKKRKAATPVKKTDAPTPDQPAIHTIFIRPLLMKLGLGLWFMVLIFFGTLSGLAFAAFEILNTAVDSTSNELILIEIPRGTSTRTIVQNLESQNLILSRWPFLAYLFLTNKSVRAGTYTLSQKLTTYEIAKQITEGNVTEQTVTIPEGWRLEQIADLLDRMGIVGSGEFLTAARYDPVRHTLPPGIELPVGSTLEGLLFPDTYRFQIGVTAAEIVKTLLDNFALRTEDLKPTYDQIVLASLVEREAKFDEDRPKIAGVYSNRLKNNLRLEADPTVQYALANQLNETQSSTTFEWWPLITVDHYQTVKSSYNTYLNLGFPPTPIAGMGLKSLKAAVQPAEHNYYFFFNLPDGQTVYSSTKAEHDQKKRQ